MALALSVLPGTSHAIEEPTYTVMRTVGDIELREYAAYTVAEVTVNAGANDAGSRAFPILAGYIFGKNKGERTLAMTAPVTQTAVPVKLEMTAPVTQTPSGSGFLVQFVLPKGVTVANAPEPLDARVNAARNAVQRVAVIRYSGFWSESNYKNTWPSCKRACALQTSRGPVNPCSRATTGRPPRGSCGAMRSGSIWHLIIAFAARLHLRRASLVGPAVWARACTALP